MKTDHVITMCMWRRPKYSQQVLNAILKCDGIEKYTVIIHLDFPEDKTLLMLLRFYRDKFSDLIVVKNRNHIGCNENTRRAIDSGFNLSDYVIHIEDDVLVSKDALRFLEWARTVDNAKEVYSATAWRHPLGWMPKDGTVKPEDNDRLAMHSSGIWVWGWSTWKDKWEIMKSHWTTGDDFTAGTSWDTWLCSHLPDPILNIAPLTSRSINIGSELGTHGADFKLDYWAGSAGFVMPNDYALK